ncbi:hypothetical protein EJD97_013450 [Solanum chilense]|uniref:Uncharacterized protein n=1 Tax=Solanum chilense TaxID=4083 RepID=A0A6N2BGH7_SOLCI|nr:hypothetical protein EJD97_013450 [Solanum chilense]
MNTLRNAACRLKEEIANVGDPPHGDQVPPHEEDSNMDHAPFSPPPLTDDNMRTALLQMAQAITTQAQRATTQSQSMMAQANREVVPRPHQQVTTMASDLRYFTRMNPRTFYGSKVDEYLQEFIGEVSKILLAGIFHK